MPSERTHFLNSHGEQLSARIDIPEGETKAFAIFAHCFTQSNLAAVRRISELLNSYGIALMRFDFTGLGNSEGDFANTNFSSNVSDILAATDYLRERYQAPRILIGHSFGGTASLASAHDIPELRAVATIGSPFDPSHIKHLFHDSLDTIRETGSTTIEVAGRSFKITQQFLEDISAHNMEERIGNLHKALLIFHAPGDTIVEIENAKKIYVAAKHPKSFISLDNADHLLTKPADAQYVATVLAAWASRYI